MVFHREHSTQFAQFFLFQKFPNDYLFFFPVRLKGERGSIDRSIFFFQKILELTTTTTFLLLLLLLAERRSPDPRGVSHGSSARVCDGRWSHRTSVRHNAIRRRRRRGHAAIRHRGFAHFIGRFYHLELRAV